LPHPPPHPSPLQVALPLQVAFGVRQLGGGGVRGRGKKR